MNSKHRVVAKRMPIADGSVDVVLCTNVTHHLPDGLLERMVNGNDPRYERYWHLIAVINGWPVAPSLAPAFDWLIAGLRAG